jgi:hypothetical protein
MTANAAGATTAAAVALLACACSESVREQAPPRRSALPPSVTRAIATVRCRAPDSWGYGFVESKCARVVRVTHAGGREWRLRLLLPPVYCIRLVVGRYANDGNLDIPGTGFVEELRCPASVYAGQPVPDLPVRMRYGGPRAGAVSLTAVNQTHTRVIVDSQVDDAAWIQTGTCRTPTGPRLFELNQFYSFRSDTIIRVAIGSLRRTPHVVLLDRGGAHGGDPLACGVIS